MDRISSEKRSWQMGRVRQKDTLPEIAVRKLVYGMGYRYRLHDRRLPGSPDLVFPARRKVIFVHGCFWHRHGGCKLASTPKTRIDFWQEKFDANKARDKRTVEALRALGWEALTLWQCEAKAAPALEKRISDFLGS